jgi:hypothetical protein
MNKPITSNKFATDTWKMVQMLIDEAVLAEREACAKACETKHFSCPFMTSGAQKCADAIRAREKNT